MNHAHHFPNPFNTEQGDTVSSAIAPHASVQPPRPAKTRRKDCCHVGAYLPTPYKRSIRLLQAVTGEDLKAILSRILNEQFRKHSLPEVHG